MSEINIETLLNSDLSQRTKFEIIEFLYARKIIRLVEYQNLLRAFVDFEQLLLEGNISEYPQGLYSNE